MFGWLKRRKAMTGDWGYTSVPEPGVKWWRGLPLRPKADVPLAV